MAQLAKHLVYKHKDFNLIPRTQVEKLACVVACTCNLSVRETEAGRQWASLIFRPGQKLQIPVRDPVSGG